MAYKPGRKTLIGTGAPGTRRASDADNDDTIVFERNQSARWVTQLSSMVPRETLEELKELDSPFDRQLPANQQSSRQRAPALPAPAPRRPQPSAAARLPPPPRAAERARHAAHARPSQPEIDYALEGELQRSLRPARTRWRARYALAVLLPVAAALVGLALANKRGEPWALLASEPLPKLASATVAPNLPVEPPAPAPALVPTSIAVAEAPAALEPEPALAEPALVSTHSTSLRAPNERRVTRAALKRHPHRARALRRAHVGRPITPLAEAEPAETAQTIDPALELGTLQINSRPWARVLVDGQFVGNTPQRALKLAPGAHRVRLINDELGMSKNIDVQIAAGQSAKYVELLNED